MAVIGETPQEAENREKIRAECDRRSLQTGQYIDEFTSIREDFPIGFAGMTGDEKLAMAKASLNRLFRRRKPKRD